VVALGQQPQADGGATIGEQVEGGYQGSQRLQTESQQRMARRQAYMEVDMERDDTGFFLAVGAAFLLPALAILVVAYATGYLDRLYDLTLSFSG
jgi:hypothetical protein